MAWTTPWLMGTAGSLRGYDNVVLAMGSRSNAVLKETAEKVAPQVFVIGEAAKAPATPSWPPMTPWKLPFRSDASITQTIANSF